MAKRPTQLSRTFLVLLCSSLVLSFLTGLGLWYVHEQREQLLEPPRWTAFCQTLHGILNPAICVLFGHLCFLHIPGGWRMAANRKSGGTLVFLMSGLIVTGVGLYYAANRHLHFTIHLLLGLLLPFAFWIHWWVGRKWARQRDENSENKER